MSGRGDRKLRQVAIASYNYRHEAEFAAGFLQEAGIPYRLQIDDPTLGLSVTDAATIWVAAMDEGRARRVLETDHPAGAEDDESWADEEAWRTGDAAEPEKDADERAMRERDVWTSLEDRDESAVGRRVKPDLTLRQRIVALLSSVGVGATLAFESIRDAPTAVAVGVVALAAFLALVALRGQAPGALRGILGALSGDAP